MGKRKSSKEEAEIFWKEKEELLKEKIQFRTYASFLGIAVPGKTDIPTDKKIGTPYSDRGGILFGAGTSVYFEDFEKKNFLTVLFAGSDSKWSKTEFSFPVNDIAEIRTVSEEGARRSIQGKISPVHAFKSGKITSRLMNNFMRFFSIRLKTGEYFFFEVLEKKDFLKFVEGRL